MMNNKRLNIISKLSITLNCELSSLSKLSEEQAKYINYYLYKSTFLEACPGSGKTEVIGLKTAYFIKKWESNNGGIAVVTFTKSAANELVSRVKKYSGISGNLFPHFIGTFDSWLHGYLLQPFSHYMTRFPGNEKDKSIRIIEDDKHAGFLNNYKINLTRNGSTRAIKATEYYCSDDWQNIDSYSEEIARFINTPPLTGQEKNFLIENKKKFIQDGFATYSDAEMLCCQLLLRYPVLRNKFCARFPVIFIDECQDLSQGQIKILEVMRANGVKLHFVGDLNQSIYEFRKVNPDDIHRYVTTQNFEFLKLTNNYRSCQPIVDISNALIGGRTRIIANLPTISQTPCIVWQYDPQNFSQLPSKFAALVAMYNLPIEKCAILARGNSTLLSLKEQAGKSNYEKVELFAIALECWFKTNRNAVDLNNALTYMGRFLCMLAYEGKGSYKREQFCPHNWKVIEWRLFLKNILNQSQNLYPFEDNGGNDIIWSAWVRNLKIFLPTIWQSLNGRTKEFNEISTTLRAPSGNANSTIKATLQTPEIENHIRTTTIHSVKGETLDAVLLISHRDRTSKGGHYSHWLREGNFTEEHIRFAYVAFSRPKHLLVLATPNINNNEIAKLQAIGFIPDV